MKRWISMLLVFALTLAYAAVVRQEASAEESYILPSSLTEIEAEAFADNTTLTQLVIPKTVTSIGSRAFANCSSLTEVYFGRNASITISDDAFAGCEGVHFYAYPETAGEQWAMSHGYVCDLLEEGSAFLDRAMSLVAENGGSSILQSGEFAAKRLIVNRSVNYLPDVSAYNPTSVVRGGSIYVIQFGTVDEAADCYTLLQNDANTLFVEADQCVEALDGVSAAGVVDGGIWNTDDPMGFDIYAPFVKENNPNGSITIAVVDSGVGNLSSYQGKLRSDGKNMLAAQDGESWSADNHRHGSVIASVISDCVGQVNVRILPVRVVGASGNTDFIAIGSGILYAAEKGASIINLSLNFAESEYVTYAINQARSRGCTVVVAAGNSSRNINNVYPANLPGVVTVSGLNKNYQLSANSNYGTGIDFCAPDSYVKTTAYSNGLFNGTSFAAPMISAAYALVKLDPYHTINDMIETCMQPDASGSPANSYGHGMPQLGGMAYIDPIRIDFGENVPTVMTVDQTSEVTWTVYPLNATVKTAEIDIDNDVLSYTKDTETGKISIKAEKPGEATVTLTVTGTDVSVTRTITVVQPVIGITLSGGKSELPIGYTMRLTATISPTDPEPSNPAIEWVSTNPAIATVDSNGLVTAVSTGSVGVYAHALDGYEATSDVFSFEVIEIPDPSGISLMVNRVNVTDGKIQMIPGQTAQIEVTINPSEADQSVKFKRLGTCISVRPDHSK